MMEMGFIKMKKSNKTAAKSVSAQKKTKITKRRFEELDLSRALPLLLLPLVHVYEEFESIDALPDSILSGYHWILYLCNLMPSIFMILMGANMYFSRKSTAKDMLKRGVTFMGIGVALNFFRFIIPSIITSIINGDPEAVIGEYGSIYYTLTPDIYDFVGLAFIAFAIFKKFNFSPLAILLSSTGLLTLDIVIPQFSTDISFVDGFIGRFIYMDVDSCFPLSTWLIFPAIGYCFGCVYKNFETEELRKKFVKRMFWVSLTGLLSMWFSLENYSLGALKVMTSPSNEYITDLPNVIMLTFLAGIWFSMFYFIYFKVKNTKVSQTLVVISKGILPFYITQWIIIGWAEYLADGLADEPMLSYATFWILTIASIIISAAAAIIVSKRKEKKKAAAANENAKDASKTNLKLAANENA